MIFIQFTSVTNFNMIAPFLNSLAWPKFLAQKESHGSRQDAFPTIFSYHSFLSYLSCDTMIRHLTLTAFHWAKNQFSNGNVVMFFF